MQWVGLLLVKIWGVEVELSPQEFKNVIYKYIYIHIYLYIYMYKDTYIHEHT